MVEKILPRTGIELGTPGSVDQRLTHAATGAPSRRKNGSMGPDRVSNLGSLTYESGALQIALCGPAQKSQSKQCRSR